MKLRDNLLRFTEKINKFFENSSSSMKLDEELTLSKIENYLATLKDATAFAASETLREAVESMDEQSPVITINDENYFRRQPTPKHYLTFFGDVIINRSYYQKSSGGKIFCPIEASLGINGEYAFPEVAEAVAFSAACAPPEEVSEMLNKSAFFHPSETCIRNMLINWGDKAEEQREIIAWETTRDFIVPDGTKTIVASLDGACLRLKPEAGLSECPFKTATCGVIAFYGDPITDQKGKLVPNHLHSIYIGRMPEKNFNSFKTLFERQLAVVLAKLTPDVNRLLIVDGARSIWEYAKSCELLKDFVPVLDYYHATEHLRDVATALFDSDIEKGNQWYEKWHDALLERDNAIAGVISSIQYYSDNLKIINTDRRKVINNNILYFHSHRNHVPYAEHCRLGLPIGSGTVEAACKTLIKTRMCQSGMHWLIRKGQHILTFRSQVKSGMWNLFWEKLRQKRHEAIPFYTPGKSRKRAA